MFVITPCFTVLSFAHKSDSVYSTAFTRSSYKWSLRRMFLSSCICSFSSDVNEQNTDGGALWVTGHWLAQVAVSVWCESMCAPCLSPSSCQPGWQGANMTVHVSRSLLTLIFDRSRRAAPVSESHAVCVGAQYLCASCHWCKVLLCSEYDFCISIPMHARFKEMYDAHASASGSP